MPNDINATASITPPSFSVGLAPNCLGVVCLVDASGEVLRRWRLQSPKCTIGSDRQATIWLEDNRIASFHALLVLGSNQAIVKSFGPGLRLNGQTVQESALRVGDRLELLGYQFLIESLSASPLAARPGAKMPDASTALDSGHLARPPIAPSAESLHLNKLEGRIEELLQRLGAIDEKITRTSAEQKDDFSQKYDSLRVESEQFRLAITQDLASQIRNLTEDLEQQSLSHEDRFHARFSSLKEDLNSLREEIESGLDQLQQQSESKLSSLQQSQQQADQRSSAISESQQLFAARINQLEAIQKEANLRLERIHQDTTERIRQIEQSAAAITAQSHLKSEPTTNSQSEIEALQERLAQLETVLGDLASSLQERVSYEFASNRSNSIETLSETFDPDNQRSEEDRFSDRTAQNESRVIHPGRKTERFVSDATTPYGDLNKRPFSEDGEVKTEAPYTNAAFEQESEDIDSVARGSDTDLPNWFTEGKEDPYTISTNGDEDSDDTYSPLLRQPSVDAAVPSPIAQWSSAASSSDEVEDEMDNAIVQDVEQSPILRSLLRKDEHEELEPGTDSPMFDQKDWEESESYLRTERPTSVTALDILRASYGENQNAGFDEEQEEKWDHKLQEFSDAIHEENTPILNSPDNAVDGEQAEEAEFQEDSPTEEEPEQVLRPEPKRLVGASASRGLGSAHDTPAPEGAPTGEDDSVEVYMQRLLARMRGDEPEQVQPAAPVVAATPKPSPVKPSSSKAVRNTYSPLRKTRQDPAAALIASRPKAEEENGEVNPELGETNPEDSTKTSEVTAPRSAPEKASDLAALRELANDSARAAVKTSDTKSKPVSSTVKLIVASLAAAFGVIILIGNGLRVNLTLVAAATSFMLSAIWILDVIQSYVNNKKRQQVSGVGNNKLQMKIAGKK